MRATDSGKTLPQDINIRTFLHSKLAWQVTFFFGCQSMTAYSSRAWLPTIMTDKGFSMAAAGLAVALTGLVGSLLAIGIPHWAHRSKDQRKAIWLISSTALIALMGIEFSSGPWLLIWVLAISISQWSVYPLALLLIILRSPNPDEAQSLSAMVQSFGYLLGASAPLITGALFDLTLTWSASLSFLFAMTLIQLWVGHLAGRVSTVQKRLT
jgi:CP family cyanate transporter-like MFS transporter